MSKAERRERIEYLKRCLEEVLQLTDAADIPEENGIVVDKDHAGPPGAVLITIKHADRTDFWKQSLRGWYVAKTEHPQ